MEKEKKLIKTVLKIIMATLGTTTIWFMIIASIIAIVIFKTNEANSNNGGGYITDIGALGVPQEYVSYYNEVSSKLNIPNWVLAAISKQESNFNPNASYGGAYGMMQIQKNDILTGINLWNNHMNSGLGETYKNFGYNFTSSDDMWNKYLTDPKAQIIAGGYLVRYYTNYVLYRNGKVNTLQYTNSENMKLIDWSKEETDREFKEILRRIFACYNGGPVYGMSVNLDNAQHDYPNKVFNYAMEFRKSGLAQGGNETIEKIINAGMKWVNKSPYVWGGGRTESDVVAGRFDCSSFVHYMYSSAGIQLGDRSSAVTFSMVNMGKKIEPKDMKRGDLIFFDTYTVNGHIGVYLGNGQFIHDGTTRGVEIANINNPYWKSTFNGNVRRIVE